MNEAYCERLCIEQGRPEDAEELLALLRHYDFDGAVMLELYRCNFGGEDELAAGKRFLEACWQI